MDFVQSCDSAFNFWLSTDETKVKSNHFKTGYQTLTTIIMTHENIHKLYVKRKLAVLSWKKKVVRRRIRYKIAVILVNWKKYPVL